MRYKSLAFAILLLAFVGWKILDPYSKDRGMILIINESRINIVGGEIEISKQHAKLGRLETNGIALVEFDIKTDSHYKIGIQFEGERNLIKEIGYVTGGRDWVDVVVVKENDIVIKELKFFKAIPTE